MHEDVYRKLAGVLDTLPNGFPGTENGVEIALLRKIFTPEQAGLFCDLRLTFETAEQVAARTGRSPAGLEDALAAMGEAGQLFSLQLGSTRFFKMIPWVFGIFEFQLGRLDRELAELSEEYWPTYAKQFCSASPQLMQVLPVEEELPVQQMPLPYEMVSRIIEEGQSFLANDCICKKEKELVGKPCAKPLQVCLAVAPLPGVFDDHPRGRVLSRQGAYALLQQSEEAGLVHLTANLQNGNLYICNCCGCCCGVLRAITVLGIPAEQVVNAHYHAVIDVDTCTACGICRERCQVGAVAEEGEAYRIVSARCIGCGLCVSTCAGGAIRLVRKEANEIDAPPLTEEAWFEERGRRRGVDFSAYK